MGLAGAVAAFAGIRSFEISQTALLETQPPTLRAYARLLDERNQPIDALAGVTVTGSLGVRALPLQAVRPFAETGQGVAYVFLVDISKSLSEREFGLIQSSLEGWISGLKPADRAAILAFGNQSRLVVDFTSDAAALRSGIAALGPTDDQTVFFEALKDGFELARRRDPGLPARRALIVLTDGRDEGSGWVVDDILEDLRNDSVPLFAIGLSRIRDLDERERYLRLLQRLATNSGGTYFRGTTQTIDASYRSIREAVETIWVLDFGCGSCPLDGRNYRLQANLSEAGRVFSDGRSVRLLPPTGLAASGAGSGSSPSEEGAAPPALVPAASAPAAPLETDPGSELGPGTGPGLEKPRPSEPAPGSDPSQKQDAAADPDGEPGTAAPAGQGTLTKLLGPAVALLILALVGWWFLGRRKRSPVTSPPSEAMSSEPEAVKETASPPAAGRDEGFRTSGGVATTRPPRPWKLRVVRLVVVRGSKPGKQYTVTLLERAKVGARSDCDCVLVGEPGVEAEQFELFQLDGNVFVRNLARSNPTLIDGLPIEDRQPIQSDTLLGTREFIVRILFGEGRATTRV